MHSQTLASTNRALANKLNCWHNITYIACKANLLVINIERHRMILGNIAMIGATAAVAGLTWRLIRVAKDEGPASLLTSHVDEALLHVCLVFVWALFVRDGLDVLWHANPSELMAGYGALFGGLLATCLARMRNRPASIASETQNG